MQGKYKPKFNLSQYDAQNIQKNMSNGHKTIKNFYFLIEIRYFCRVVK